MMSSGLGDGQGDWRLLHRELINDAIPGADLGWTYSAKGPPHSTITLEPGAKGNLPHSVASLHSALGLSVRQFIPQGAAGCVPKPATTTLLNNFL